ncbi:MAG: GntR family transcriptional regulator [Sneathiellales bacterium]|nr:GntR family transcriptional regulator [Sneathiellales bacterium]
MPTEPELQELLGVGRSTLREAMANLESKGILERIQGKGTFIRQIPILLENGLDELRSVSEHIRAVGATPSTSRLEVSFGTATEEIVGKLELKIGDPITKIERVRRADHELAAYCIDIVPRKLLPDATEEEFSGSLFELFDAHRRIISHANSNLRPTVLTRRDLPELKSEVGLFLLFDEVFYDKSGVPLCYSNDYYSADIFDFRMVRRR